MVMRQRTTNEIGLSLIWQLYCVTIAVESKLRLVEYLLTLWFFIVGSPIHFRVVASGKPVLGTKSSKKSYDS
jgi:hypothetical protein